jgi:hypothetical protein
VRESNIVALRGCNLLAMQATLALVACSNFLGMAGLRE